MVFCILFSFYLKFLNAALKHYETEEIKEEINFDGDERFAHNTKLFVITQSVKQSFS